MATALAIGAGAPMPASAQETGTEIGVAYQFLRFGEFELNYPVGFNVDVSFPLPADDRVALVGEVNFGRHTEDGFSNNLTGFAAGARVCLIRNAGFTTYGQFLAGAQRDSFEDFSSTDLMFALDGGVQIPVNDAWDAFGQVGLRRVNYSDDDFGGQNALRLLLGFRLNLR